MGRGVLPGKGLLPEQHTHRDLVLEERARELSGAPREEPSHSAARLVGALNTQGYTTVYARTSDGRSATVYLAPYVSAMVESDPEMFCPHQGRVPRLSEKGIAYVAKNFDVEPINGREAVRVHAYVGLPLADGKRRPADLGGFDVPGYIMATYFRSDTHPAFFLLASDVVRELLQQDVERTDSSPMFEPFALDDGYLALTDEGLVHVARTYESTIVTTKSNQRFARLEKTEYPTPPVKERRSTILEQNYFDGLPPTTSETQIDAHIKGDDPSIARRCRDPVDTYPHGRVEPKIH